MHTDLYPERFDEFHEVDCLLQHRLKHSGPAFFQSFGRFTPIQRLALPEILEGKDTLLLSGTATGKTEAACAPLIERFYSQRKPWTILYISPTRALINDLYFRLLKPVSTLNLTIKRRTGDHRDNLSQLPNILITTPESFDSLLCRNRRSDGLGHDLAHVRAVILDEIHLLHGTPRGEQLKWLLKRLKKLRSFSQSQGWSSTSDIQIIGLSATVPNANLVVEAYFSGPVSIIESDKNRPIEVVKNPSGSMDAESLIVEYVTNLRRNEKIIVFSNSRKRVDLLTSFLKEHLRPLGYGVFAHHGSLSKSERERAEWVAKHKEKIILIATSTLEIGIDIGDIDLVILDGPPPDVSALLQRIGRGNRRTDKTRVMLCANRVPEFLLQQAMINAASDGWLGEDTYGPYYSVIRQQIASYIFQSPMKKRTMRSLSDLFSTTGQNNSMVSEILKSMIESDELIEIENNIVKLGDYWWELAEKMGLIHSTIERGSGNAVIDIDSGRPIAYDVRYDGGKGMGIAGKALEIKKWEKLRIEVRDLVRDPTLRGKWNYDTKTFFLSSSQPLSLKRYLQIEDDIWPLLRKDGYLYAFHFGGATRKSVLALIQQQYGLVRGHTKINEWFIRLPGSVDMKPETLNRFSPDVLKLLLYSEERMLGKIESFLNRPVANKVLPTNVRVEEIWNWLNLKFEEKNIKSSKWEFLGDDDIDNVLKHFTS